MNTLKWKRAAVLTIALFVGMVALSQVMHDESQAIGMCSMSCKCVTCGSSATPAKLCYDYMTFCRGMHLVRNCAQYCSSTFSQGLLPVDF